MGNRPFWILALALLGCGAPSTAPAPTPPKPKACSQIGCSNGLDLELVRPSAWPAGRYRFTLTVDGKSTRCEGALPLKACDDGPSFHCDDGGLTLSESGCALPPEQHAISGLHSTATEASEVSLLIEHEGSIQATAKLHPAFDTLQPNGPGCEPVCQSASMRLTLR